VLYLNFYNINLLQQQMSDFKNITDLLIKFRDERDWKQFHNSKDLALAISIEAAELNELFLWKSNEDVNKERLKEELADIFSFALLLAEKHKLDVPSIIKDKMKLNGKKYTVEKAKGSAKKYNEF
jgi:NTP pyrophosphatase (non-canonical NTP hydrolase)